MRVVLLFSGKLNEWFNANVLQGVCEVLEPEGYDVSPTFVTGRQETERYFAKLPKNRNADAIIISSFQLDESAREKLRVTDMPTVGVNIPAESFCDAAIGVDNYDGMSKAVRLLKSLDTSASLSSLITFPTTWSTAPASVWKRSWKRLNKTVTTMSMPTS